MSYIRVAFTKGVIDYVADRHLDLLIGENEITHFYRPSDKTWVNIKTDPIRGRGGFYLGPERRGKGPKGWIERLCQDIER